MLELILIDCCRCLCLLGYQGSRCEIIVQSCSYQPCLNGGTCSDGLDDFNCLCSLGYRGRFCEESKQYLSLTDLLGFNCVCISH